MNSVPNSDSEQCPESKLGWVHRVHILGPGCAHAPHWAYRVVASQAPCHRPPPTVSWTSSRLCRSAHRSCRRSCHALCRAPVCATARRVASSSAMSRASRLYRGACPAMSQHCIATQLAARLSSCHNRNDCIMTNPTGHTSLLS